MNPDLGSIVSLLVWVAVALFGGMGVFWLYEVVVLAKDYDTPTAEYGPDDIQVRILTVDAASIVQQTVDSLPGTVSDCHVIAEEPMSITGAEVHVVPGEFECDAVHKGRALEWARRTLACDCEYVLYLDEDSVVEELDGLPDADVVQIHERPRRTDSWFAYLADVYRMGAQFEQHAFHRFRIPLFAWGGGIAVRKSLEDQITWDRATLVEDTAFVWQAAQTTSVSYALTTVSFTNQAPPTFWEIFQQRRRWAAGNHQEANKLPTRYRVLTKYRSYAWAASPLIPCITLSMTLSGQDFLYGGVLQAVSLGLALLMVGWFALGLAHYDRLTLRSLPLLALAPLAAIVHSVGATAGLVAPPDDFHVTAKQPTTSHTTQQPSTEQNAD